MTWKLSGGLGCGWCILAFDSINMRLQNKAPHGPHGPHGPQQNSSTNLEGVRRVGGKARVFDRRKTLQAVRPVRARAVIGQFPPRTWEGWEKVLDNELKDSIMFCFCTR